MTSRRELYAMGEPLGDGATRAKLGGGVVCGFGGDSSSSNTNQQITNTYQYDQRQIYDQRQNNTSQSWTNNQTDSRAFTTNNTSNQSDVGNTTTSLTDSNNTTNNLTVLDAGAISAGKDIALSGISNNATNTDHLLTVADNLFSKTTSMLDANTKLAASLASGANQAYADATSQATGNKNLVYAGMAVVGIVAVSFFWKK